MKNTKTFAQRAADIERKFKGRLDTVSVRTKKSLMQDLRDEQEALKAQMDANNPTNQHAKGGELGNGVVATTEDDSMNPAFFSQNAGQGIVPPPVDNNLAGATQQTPFQTMPSLGQANPQTTPFQAPQVQAPQLAASGRPMATSVNAGMTSVGNTQLSGGAKLPTEPDVPKKAKTGGKGGAGAGAVVGAVGGVLDLGKMAFGKSGIDKSGATKAPEVKVGATAAKGAMKGAQAGMAFGPWGAVIGGVVGGVAGFVGGSKAKKEAAEARGNYDLNLANKYRPSDYAVSAYGGILPKAGGGLLEDPAPTLPISSFTAGPKPKWRPMPSDVDPQTQNQNRIAWAKQQRMSSGELGAFEDQRGDIQDTSANRDSYLSLGMQQWRRGSTGATPHSKYSIGSDEYTNAKNKLIQESYQMFPRTVNQGVQNYASRRKQMAYGGLVNKYDGLYGPSLLKKEGATWDNLNFQSNPLGLKNDFASSGGQDYSIQTPQSNFSQAQAPSALNKTGAVWEDLTLNSFDPKKMSTAQKAALWAGKNSGNILQYANVLGSLTNKIKRGDTPKGSRLIGKTNLDRIDEQSVANSIKGNVNIAGSARETSGGSLSSYAAGTRLGNKQLLEAISNANINARQINMQQGNTEEQMNLQKNSINMAADERWQERKAQDEGAYQSAKQANRAAIFDNISAIGREETDKKIVKEMYGYKWNGKYWIDPKGKKVSQLEYDNVIKKSNEQKQAMFGGYLKK
ncbi:MAG: hypothetical protein ACSLE0_23495 [Chitinophagaceae bacterium]